MFPAQPRQSCSRCKCAGEHDHLRAGIYQISAPAPAGPASGHFEQIQPGMAPAKFPAGFFLQLPCQLIYLATVKDKY